MGKNHGGCKNGFNGRHRNGRESRLLKNTDSIPISFNNDQEGRKFLNCCIFSRHTSILGNIKAKRCKKKGCDYYARFYYEKKSEKNY